MEISNKDIQSLKTFVDRLRKDPSLLSKPQFSFFTQYLEELGATIPTPTKEKEKEKEKGKEKEKSNNKSEAKAKTKAKVEAKPEAKPEAKIEEEMDTDEDLQEKPFEWKDEEENSQDKEGKKRK